MKRKNKIIEKIKRFLPLLLAVILSGSMILGLWLFSRSKGVNTVSASAEITGEIDEVLPEGFRSQVKTANLIPYPYFDEWKYSSNGVSVRVLRDGCVVLNGTTMAYCLMLLNDTYDRLRK